MKKPILEDIPIRNDLRPGDMGRVIQMHGELYSREYGFGLQFETYVAKGLCEFYERYDPVKDRVWVCEHAGRMIGFMLLMHREEAAAQLRYFLIEPGYRGIGLGARLMGLFMEHLKNRGYRKAHLWTTHELLAAAHLYEKAGFALTEEKESAAFGKPLVERRYDLSLQQGAGSRLPGRLEWAF
jgi:peptidyl-dipeptidase Dcp